MNITVTITVDLNVLQNAAKCTISEDKISIFFWRGGTAPSPDPTPVEPPPNHISGYGPVSMFCRTERKVRHTQVLFLHDLQLQARRVPNHETNNRVDRLAN